MVIARVFWGVLAGLLLVGCGGSMGTLRGALADTAFVDEAAQIRFHDAWGLRRISLDGTGRTDLFPRTYSLLDELPGGPFALGNSNTDLFISSGPGDVRVVPELRGRVSRVRFSNDGSRLVASRHADFELPQSDWVDDDAIYLIDAKTLEVKIYPARSDRWIVSLGWSDDGTEVWTESQDHVDEWLNLATGERRPRSPDDRPNARGEPGVWGTVGCATEGLSLDTNDEGIFLVHPDGAREALVYLDGRERGFHDYLPSFGAAFFTPSCRHVVFSYNRAVWVAQVTTKKVGKLVDGDSPMPIP